METAISTDIPKIDEASGMRYYDSLPSNTRKATKDDFFKGEDPIIGLYYLIHSYHYPMFQIFRVNFNFVYEENVEPWMADGRVYVRKDYCVK
jgi:hypothetical protein